MAAGQPRAGALGRAAGGQLGSFSAELVHPGAALAMDDALGLAMLSAACAVAEGRPAGTRAASARVRRPAASDRPSVAGPGDAQRPGPLGDGTAGRSRLRARSDNAAPSPARRQASPSCRRRPGAPSPRRAPASGQRVCCGCRRSWWAATKPTPTDWRDGLRLTGTSWRAMHSATSTARCLLARQMLYDRVAALAAETEQQDAG